MTIRLRTTARTKSVQPVRKAMATYPAYARDTFAEVGNEIGAPLILFLSTSPGPAAKPVVWTSEPQAWAYIFTGGFGRGIPTNRTGAVLAGWQQRTEVRSDNRDVWVVENPVDYSRFVFGKLNKRLSDAIKPQQIFHRNTGYPLAARHTNQASEDFRDEYEARIRPTNTADFVRRSSTSRGHV